ncbi:LOW QUALITY PROTEIN: Fc receptor-like protein 6 [Macrotis lagotis]|uniref:LOW QUALITY PROTEIN: Fc receptor-like protein 6 n=1 Tax=Macrotis lagotis TaxID=92651 RepID=UPI003D6893F9
MRKLGSQEREQLTQSYTAFMAKPILSLQPPWTTVFYYEKVYVTCEHLDLMGLGNFLWYYEGKKSCQTSGNTIMISKSGQYNCENQESVLGDPVTITFSRDWLILQVPYSVFEGDAVILQCQGWKKAKLSQITFHKWRKIIYFTKENKVLSIKAASKEHSGKYSCSGYVNNQKTNQSSEPVILQIQKLFPQPELKIKNSTEAMETSSMTLSCETQLPFQRSTSLLYFSFYKDNRTIRYRDQDPEYCIPATIMAGSGFYWCVAATENGQVQKQSLRLEIQGSTSLLTWHKRRQLVLGIPLALFGITAITAIFLLNIRLFKKAEGTAVPDLFRGPLFSRTPKSSSSQDLESCSMYVNVNPLDEKSEDVIYSVVFFREQRKKAVFKDPSPREEDCSVIYSKVIIPQNQKLSLGKGDKYRKPQADKTQATQEMMTIQTLVIPDSPLPLPSLQFEMPSETGEKLPPIREPSPPTQKMKLNLLPHCKESKSP